MTDGTKKAVLEYLRARGQSITFAESCTGGLLAASLVDLPSASCVLNESYVTYANEAKCALLGVSSETLTAYGAVSIETAAEMAEGAARRAHADAAVAVSGIAGPGGATEGKPVGTVAFGFYLDGKTETRLMHFGALGRQAVREAAVQYVWDTLAELLGAEGNG